MENIRKNLVLCTALLCMIILILDTKTAIHGANEGIALCIYSILPTLFPFCVISKIITKTAVGKSFTILYPLGKLCGIPKGAETIMILGLLGGYPVGAQIISDAYRDGSLTQSDAKRMLGFCNNAGPAFLFGILGGLFPEKRVLWCILAIQILTSVIVGIILPGKSKYSCKLTESQNVSVIPCIKESISTIAHVCCWVILFRIILTFLKSWFLWLFPVEFTAAIVGFFELSNGCIALYQIPTLGIRYILSGILLSFGGLCVVMQTISVTQNLGKTIYVYGKLLQSMISFLLCGISQYFLFPHEQILQIPLLIYFIVIAIIATICLYIYKKKKVVAFMRQVLYNDKKHKRSPVYAVSKENAA